MTHPVSAITRDSSAYCASSKLVVRDAAVANAGVAFTDIADADLPASKPFEKIRGYKAEDKGSLRVEVPGPGHWVLTGAGKLEKVGDKAEL